MTTQSWVPSSSGVALKDLPLWNAAMSYMDAPIRLTNTPASLRLSPIASPNMTGPVHVFRTAQDETFLIHLDAFPYKDLFDVDLDLAALKGLPEALANAIHIGSAETLIDAFPDTLTRGLIVDTMLTPDLVRSLPDAAALSWFAAALDGVSKQSIFFSVGVTAVDICTVLKNKMIQPKSVIADLKHALTVPISRLVGQATLALNDVNGIAVGDFVVLEHPPEGAVSILAEGHIHIFDQVDDGWQCTAVRHLESIRKNPIMTQNDDPLAPSDDLAETDGRLQSLPDMAAIVETTLTFECGETKVSLAELESYQAGTIALLPESLTKDVLTITIRAGDYPIASGELVQVEDRFAVRINRVLAKTS